MTHCLRTAFSRPRARQLPDGGLGLGHPQSSGIQVPKSPGAKCGRGSTCNPPRTPATNRHRQRVWGALEILCPLLALQMDLTYELSEA